MNSQHEMITHFQCYRGRATKFKEAVAGLKDFANSVQDLALKRLCLEELLVQDQSFKVKVDESLSHDGEDRTCTFHHTNVGLAVVSFGMPSGIVVIYSKRSSFGHYDELMMAVWQNQNSAQDIKSAIKECPLIQGVLNVTFDGMKQKDVAMASFWKSVEGFCLVPVSKIKDLVSPVPTIEVAEKELQMKTVPEILDQLASVTPNDLLGQFIQARLGVHNVKVSEDVVKMLKFNIKQQTKASSLVSLLSTVVPRINDMISHEIDSLLVQAEFIDEFVEKVGLDDPAVDSIIERMAENLARPDRGESRHANRNDYLSGRRRGR